MLKTLIIRRQVCRSTAWFHIAGDVSSCEASRVIFKGFLRTARRLVAVGSKLVNREVSGRIRGPRCGLIGDVTLSHLECRRETEGNAVKRPVSAPLPCYEAHPMVTNVDGIRENSDGLGGLPINGQTTADADGSPAEVTT